MIDALALMLAIAAGYFRLFNTLLWAGGCALLSIYIFGHAWSFAGASLGGLIGLWADLGSSGVMPPWRKIIDYSGFSVFLAGVLAFLLLS
ncbi:MAG: hypothetical protein ACRCTD_14800 [Beijerinckiaceae bacterium]